MLYVLSIIRCGQCFGLVEPDALNHTMVLGCSEAATQYHDVSGYGYLVHIHYALGKPYLTVHHDGTVSHG